MKMKKYDEIKFKELDWYVIDTNEDTTKLLLKNVLDEERIKKYADDDFMFNGHDVRHQDNIRPFDWNKSYIKNTILPNFIKDLGIECEVTLLSKEEAEELPEDIRKSNDCYWTKTPFSGNSYGAWGVGNDGDVGSYGNVRTGHGVRPVLIVDNTLLVSEDEFIDIRELGIPGIDTVENERICRAEYKINDLIKNQKLIINKLKEEGK